MRQQRTTFVRLTESGVERETVIGADPETPAGHGWVAETPVVANHLMGCLLRELTRRLLSALPIRMHRGDLSRRATIAEFEAGVLR